MKEYTIYECTYCGARFDDREKCVEHERKCIKKSYAKYELRVSTAEDGIEFADGEPARHMEKVKGALDVGWSNWTNRLVFSMQMAASMSKDVARLLLVKTAVRWMEAKVKELGKKEAEMEAGINAKGGNTDDKKEG